MKSQAAELSRNIGATICTLGLIIAPTYALTRPDDPVSKGCSKNGGFAKLPEHDPDSDVWSFSVDEDAKRLGICKDGTVVRLDG